MIGQVKEALELRLLLKEHWEEPSTIGVLLFAITVIGFITAYYFDVAQLQQAITWGEAIGIGWILLVVFSFWYWTTRLPKTPDGKIGIAVAISCETKKERERLKNDLMASLKHEIQKGHHQHLHVFELSERRSKSITNHECARNYLVRTKSHLMIYGHCRMRHHEGQPTYVFELNGSVRHAPIPMEVSKQFSNDISLALPKRTLFSEANELRGFEFTRSIIGLASRYILGIACSISGDSGKAFDLHHGVWTELKLFSEQEIEDVPLFRNLNARAAALLVQEGLELANQKFTRKPDGYLAEMAKYLDIVQSIAPNHYGAHLLKGIYYFLRSRDIENAKREIRKAKNKSDSASLWSSAFLEAYEGRLEQAHKIYQRAFRAECADFTPLQVETFIADVLQAEPDKVQLWYCLGMINYLYKADLDSGRKDFLEFLRLAPESGNFAKSVEFAKSYVAQIDQGILPPRES